MGSNRDGHDWVTKHSHTWNYVHLNIKTNIESGYLWVVRWWISNLFLIYFCKVWGKQISIQFSSVPQSCPTLCDPMSCSTPGLPVHHQLPEFTQTHVCWVKDAIQPSHLLSPSPPALHLSQHQGLFKWVSSSHQVAKVLGVSTVTSVIPMNTQDWSPLGWTGSISLQSKGFSRVFSKNSN